MVEGVRMKRLVSQSFNRLPKSTWMAKIYFCIVACPFMWPLFAELQLMHRALLFKKDVLGQLDFEPVIAPDRKKYGHSYIQSRIS